MTVTVDDASGEMTLRAETLGKLEAEAKKCIGSGAFLEREGDEVTVGNSWPKDASVEDERIIRFASVELLTVALARDGDAFVLTLPSRDELTDVFENRKAEAYECPACDERADFRHSTDAGSSTRMPYLDKLCVGEEYLYIHMEDDDDN